MTQKRQVQEEETMKLHAKTFKAWMNNQLKVCGVRVIDIKEDLQDGLILIALMEILTGIKCKAKYHLQPAKDIHKIENCAIAIDFIKQFFPINVAAKDISEGNMKIILGLIWRIILQYQVLERNPGSPGTGPEILKGEPGEGKSVTVRTREAKHQLLEWIKTKTAGYAGVKIENFDTSFMDGLAICALVHKYDPTLINYDGLDKNDIFGNLTKAFQLAEDHMGIPQVIDPKDMVNPDPNLRPDEQCIMTYLSEFPRAFLNQLEKQAAAGGAGAGAGAGVGAAGVGAAGGLERKSVALSRRSVVRQSVVGARVIGEGGEIVGIQFGEIGYSAGAPTGKPQFSVAEVFNPTVSQAQVFNVPQGGVLPELDPSGLPSHWELQKALTDAELQKLMAEKLRLEEELRALRTRAIGVLTVGVIEARGLMGLDLRGKSDPYAILTVERQREKTKKIKNTINPKWDSGFKFYVSEPDALLQIVLYDWDRFLPDEFLGKLLIPVAELPDGQQFDRWYTLLPKKPGRKVSGELCLRILYQKEK